MTKAKDLIQKLEFMEKDRSVFESHWSEVAEVVLPRSDTFNNKFQTQGEKRTNKKYDDTATMALDHGAAAIEGVVSPRGQKWHGVEPSGEAKEDQRSKEWSDSFVTFLFKQRYSAKSNFASQLHECYLSLLAFGNCVMIVEDMLNGYIRYKSGHLKEFYFSENAFGKVDTVYRKYELTARQALERFGDNTPEKVMKALEKTPEKKFEFVHCVKPDDDNEVDFPFVSYHLMCDGAEMISVGGFKSLPYIISRWTTSANEMYGRSPAMSVLSEIKMLNQMRKTDLRARHLAVDPPIMAADQQTVRKFSMKPNSINYGSLDANGNPLVRPWQTGGSIQASNDGMEQSREFINRAFFLNLFQILVDSPQMTATEVLQRAQEKGQLLTPTAGRQMSELLEPIIMREIDIYEEYGLFEDNAPFALPEAMKATEGEFEIVYTNPLSKMQMAEEAVGVERTIQALLPLAQIDPSILERVDWNEYGNIMRDANGAPAKLFKSEEELEEIAKQKQQQAMTQQIIEAAPQVAGSIKDLAQAESFANG